MIKAILWDNDGILVDSEPLYYRANREELALHGVELSKRQYLDISLREGRAVLDLAREAAADDAAIERLRASRNARYGSLLAAGVEVMPGVRECLEHLRGRFSMAIVTSSRRDHFEIAHRGTGLLDFFEFVLTPDLYGRHKPHPEPYLTAASRLGLAPEECIAVEDSERGLRSAVAAGMRCLAIPHPLTRGGDFSAAHRVLESVREVPAALQLLLA